MVRDRSLPQFCHFLYGLLVGSQINLGRDYETRHAGAVVVHFWKPLMLDILERCREAYTEAGDEYVRLWV